MIAPRRRISWAPRTLVTLAGVAGAAYAGYVAAAWLRYGRAAKRDADSDELLDRFMPVYDIAERHHLGVAAPADITFAASMEMDLEDSPIIRAIFKGREILLGAEPQRDVRPRGLVAMTKELGWGVLAERPNRELVMGAVTQPWKANVTFRSLPPGEFAAFHEPGFVKIVWTLRADEVGANRSIARTERRAQATDPEARRRFRWYWARFSAGIVLIREISIRLIKAEAERLASRSARQWQGDRHDRPAF
jgi:hypothetical protein